MKTNIYKANASVIFTDEAGRQVDTFVIFDTDPETGLTHINHHNLKVAGDRLLIHPKTVGDYHLPLEDAFSFEMLLKLRAKYERIDKKELSSKLHPPMQVVVNNLEKQTGTAAA